MSTMPAATQSGASARRVFTSIALLSLRVGKNGANTPQRWLGLLVQRADVQALVAEHRKHGRDANPVDDHVPAAGISDRAAERALMGEASDPAGDAKAGSGYR